MAGGRFRELLKKYGKVALGVHFSVSAASVTGLYVAVKSNVDVESMLQKIGMPTGLMNKGGADSDATKLPAPNDSVMTDDFMVQDQAQPQAQAQIQPIQQAKPRNRTAELAASTGGALTLAILLNKALFPVRVPITIALTPPVARFLARRNIIKNSV